VCLCVRAASVVRHAKWEHSILWLRRAAASVDPLALGLLQSPRPAEMTTVTVPTWHVHEMHQ
jgi:hypothetical protein